MVTGHRGDGTRLRFYYEVRNPVFCPLRAASTSCACCRALSEKEGNSYNVASVPYHYTLDDPPGSGLDDVFAPTFNFANEGAVADARVQGTCSTSCPTSGLLDVQQAVSFGYIVANGMQIARAHPSRICRPAADRAGLLSVGEATAGGRLPPASTKTRAR
ncbi:MAG: hypothetical protein R2873_04190 [Caldilineaceae bacterium]